MIKVLHLQYSQIINHNMSKVSNCMAHVATHLIYSKMKGSGYKFCKCLFLTSLRKDIMIYMHCIKSMESWRSLASTGIKIISEWRETRTDINFRMSPQWQQREILCNEQTSESAASEPPRYSAKQGVSFCYREDGIKNDLGMQWG